MILIIGDARILIDMEYGELLVAMFSLPYKYAVPDILFVEELMESSDQLLDLGLIDQTMSSDQITEAFYLRQQFTKPSAHNLLALTLAKQFGSPLLVADAALAEVATLYQVEVYDVMWLIKQMIQQKKITLEKARIAIQRLKDAGRWPWNEVDRAC